MITGALVELIMLKEKSGLCWC